MSRNEMFVKRLYILRHVIENTSKIVGCLAIEAHQYIYDEYDEIVSKEWTLLTSALIELVAESRIGSNMPKAFRTTGQESESLN